MKTTDRIPASTTGTPNPFHQITLELYRDNLAFLDGMQPALKRALIYISQHYHRPLLLDEVAEQSFVSSSHLSYLFRIHLGLRFKAILTELRLRHAATLINHDPGRMITDISLEAGFFDLSHFEKVFRRYFGVSPRDYRKLIREDQGRRNKDRMIKQDQSARTITITNPKTIIGINQNNTNSERPAYQQN